MKRRYLVALAVLVALGPSVAFAQGAPGGEATPLDNISGFSLWAMIGGSVTSFATAALNRTRWSSAAKLAVFLVCCCITAGLDAYFKRELDFHNFSRALPVVIGTGWATYIAARPAIKQIEVATG